MTVIGCVIWYLFDIESVNDSGRTANNISKIITWKLLCFYIGHVATHIEIVVLCRNTFMMLRKIL